jgi:hypothetical protein
MAKLLSVFGLSLLRTTNGAFINLSSIDRFNFYNGIFSKYVSLKNAGRYYEFNEETDEYVLMNKFLSQAVPMDLGMNLCTDLDTDVQMTIEIKSGATSKETTAANTIKAIKAIKVAKTKSNFSIPKFNE